jgi:AcrR family transcriptional regulator
MRMAATATGARRTQAERRASSRAKLVDATLACLAERGYAGASLPEIVRRAGLSNGALWRHFRSKADLLAAASMEAEERLLSVNSGVLSSEASSPLGAGGGGAAERVDAVVDQMLRWAEQPAMFAILELLLASRADDELRGALAASDERAAALFVDEIAMPLGPELAAHPHFRENVRQLGLMLYGIAATQHLRTPAARGMMVCELRELGRRLFDLEPFLDR